MENIELKKSSNLKDQEESIFYPNSRTMILDDGFPFPLEVVYKEKKYILHLTKNDKLMLQKPF